ncbi:phenylacetate--CoA ligase family protein [Methanosarcina barkeri]|uniref:Capsular polysaccharide biosynthesis protein n=1 Tax=Methanosarcina barkeri 227 TaxID=1434106 RepID=A0A0E3R3R3_METBA|nr:phenylacetate--CoA ligase family protein [Methanosarcina barkeri]AKB58117.1 capsular polysaccharide biosynthesis protein [Methanosarcina barkeri 227]
MFHKEVFIAAHQCGELSFYSSHKQLKRNQWNSYYELKKQQESKLRHMIDFAYENVPFYHKLFNRLNLSPNNIREIKDLEKLPILTKDIILSNWDDFKPINLNKTKYYTWSTGGTTGTPLKFRISKYDRFLGGAMLYRGWGYGGYNLGDKMIFLAGAALDIGSKSISSKINEIVRNLKKFSSFDMGPLDMDNYIKSINSFKPNFFRGYASSLDFFAKYVEENNLKVNSPVSVFTTAEKLYPSMRKRIENAFDSVVYDNYGLNDGGVSAFECSEHNGLHIDTERSIMEIVDSDRLQMESGIGDIIATSLTNYSMPLIRYATGDMGHIIEDSCCCGRNSRLLKEVIGRNVDILQTPEGKFIHGEFFTHIFWELDGVKEFQVIQTNLNNIIVKIVPEISFDEKQIEFIKKMISMRSSGWNIEFKFVDTIDRTKAGKYRFVINELEL